VLPSLKDGTGEEIAITRGALCERAVSHRYYCLASLVALVHDAASVLIGVIAAEGAVVDGDHCEVASDSAVVEQSAALGRLIATDR